MRTKENARKPVRKLNLRTIKIFGILALTVAALVATSIIGPTTRKGKVKAFADFAQLDLNASTFTTRSGVSNNYVITGGIVPGILQFANYVPPAIGEQGYRGAVDGCVSLYSLDCSHNAVGKSCGSCTPVSVADADLNTTDHKWVQGEENQALIY